MYKKMQLKNGMNVIFVESHKSPVVSVQMWVKTGSADEQKGEEGISHFIEHLVFKGTQKYKVGEIASTVEGSGGELNAYTSFDQTVFYVTISKNFLNIGIDVISQMMGFPLFDEEEIDNEREVVIEEIKRGLDSAGRVSSQQLFSGLYKKHPYGRPVIGYEKVIRKVSKKTLVDYFQRRYVPENMTLVIAGDFESQKVKPLVKEHFGAFKPYPLKKVKRAKEEKILKPRIISKKGKFKENSLYIAWPLPKVDHKDIAAMDVAALILGQGESSRLFQKLRVQNPLVNYIGTSSYTPLDPGFFTVAASLNEKTYKEAMNDICDTICDFLSAPPSQEEMRKALVNFESDELYGLETVDGLSRTVGTNQHLFGDPSYNKVFMKQVRDLTPNEVVRVARKYLKPENMVLSYLTATDEKAAKRVFQSWQKRYVKQFEAAKKNKVPTEGKKVRLPKPKLVNSNKNPELKTVALDSGTEVVLYKIYDTPVVSLKAAFLGGLRVEPENKIGSSELLSRLWPAETDQLTETELSEAIDSIAGGLSAFAGRNTCGLSMSSLSHYSEQMRDYFFQCLHRAPTNESILVREKAMLKEAIKRRDDNPAQQCMLQFSKEMFKGHPYSRDPLGDENILEQIHMSDLVEHQKKMSQAKNCKMVLAGNFNEKEWLEVLNREMSSLGKGKPLSSKFKFEPPIKNKLLKSKSDKEQTHIVLGYPGCTLRDPSKYVLNVMQSVLAGQGGRLFLELRDKESLAYSVSPLKLEGLDAGYFGAYIGCSPEKTNKALDMMRREFQKLVNTPIGAEELDRAKRYLIGRHDIELQKTTSIASGILFDIIYGEDADEVFNFANKVNAVTSDQIQSLAKKMFSQPELVSIV